MSTPSVCPACDSERAGAFRYCRTCGFDFDTATLAADVRVDTRLKIDHEAAAISIASIFIAALAFADAPLVLRLAPGVVGVALLPGYALSLAILPGHLDRFDRIGLAFGLSLAVTIVAALVLDVTTGLTQRALVAGLTLTTLTLSALAWIRRQRNARAIARSDGASDRATWRAPEIATVLMLIVVGLIAFGGVATMLIATPTPTTEFYVLGPNGLAEGYPRNLRAGDTATITVGIANRERASARYRVSVQTADRTLVDMPPVDLAIGQDWRGQVSFALSDPAPDTEVRILLFKDGQSDAYRMLRLWINASPSR